MATRRARVIEKTPVKTGPVGEQLERVRHLCLALPGTSEKLSHGEPTFFAAGKVFAMFSDNHHGDGHIAVVIPAAEGEQTLLIKASPAIYYRPPYVGVRDWVGIDLDCIEDEELAVHLQEAWRIIASKATAKRRSAS